jgi:hypothetical protein
VISRNYFTRQATTLLKFAQSTSDPNVAAGLVEKAADLKSRVDETSLPPDQGSQVLKPWNTHLLKRMSRR